MYVSDNMAEWLRRQPAKLMGYARVGSNPTVVDNFLCALRWWMQVCPCGAMDSASDFGSGGWGFESPQGLLFFSFARSPQWSRERLCNRFSPETLGVVQVWPSG